MKAARKFMAFLIATTMMASNIAPAFASGLKYDSPQAEIVNNKLQVNPAKPGKGKSSKDLVNNPVQPAIYTLRTDYRVQKGEKYEIDYQPYIASVGGGASEEEKKKVNKEITLPDLAGYDKSQLDGTYKIDYDTVKNEADGNNETGSEEDGKRYFANQDFKYKAKSNEIKIKHLFQDMKDFTKYTNPDGSVGKDGELITTQNGNTGSTMEVSPLNENDRRGFVPEAKFITMRVPEDSKDFVLEYRYNRAHYDVDFDTMGGTALPTRTYYYDQEIPKIEKEHIPTKEGCVFLGWKPSHDLQTTDGKTYKANQIIEKADGKPAFDLDVKLKMPALLLGKDEKSRERLTFTAVWKDKEKADYAVQFWTEKADHADNASIMEKYEYLSTRVYKDEPTGKQPKLKDEPVNGLKFPDLDKTRLQKIWAGERFNFGKNPYLNKFYVYNEKLTNEQNADPKNPSVVKKVEATGKTVYNIYYDRQVYDLYFTKSNAQPKKHTIYPEIWGYDQKNGEAVMLGGPGKLYHYKARFNEMMYKWPNDAKQTKGFTTGYQSFGWGPNYTVPNFPLHLDTPPYRLNADEFLDMSNYTNWGGYTKHIDKGDGTTMDLDKFDFTTLSFGIKQDHPSIPHHMDFWMDGFKDGETIIRYDLVRTKADTAASDYGHRYPKVTGFTPHDYEPGNPQSAWPVIREGSEEDGRVDADRINDLNDERDDITPNNSGKYYNNYGTKLPIGQLDFIKAFFSDSDEFGDPLGGEESAFKENGYLRFKYKRNKYPLRFNYDPSITRDDSYFNSKNSLDTFYEFPLKVLSPDLVDSNLDREGKEYYKEDPKNLLDNPENLQKLGLTDLVFTDKDGKLKVKRPEGLSDQMVFKGWALDPAGSKLVWEHKDEKMPFHPLNLYAKWDEPDYKWKVTFDPDGGKLKTIKEENLTEKRKTIQEGDIGQEEKNTYAKKGYLKEDATTPDGKQIFTVIQRQKLVKPVPPTKKGYDFMGWEVIHYKKNEKGDYTNEIDTSYRDKYGVPELYTFGNDVVSPIYLKAIWNPNQRVDVKVTHHLLDKDCKKDKTKKDPIDWLENKRTGYYTATVGDRQGETWILAPHSELINTKDQEIKKLYEDYNKKFGFNNTYFQNQRIEPEKIKDTNTGEMIPNPDYKGNEFHFFYRPFRQRQYTVNYLDERGKEEVKKFIKGLEFISTDNLTGAKLLEANQANKEKFEANKTKLNDIVKKYQIVDPELVTNGNRHYDARNYRRIPGWVLAENEKPQQQLFFDLNEEKNEFLGINGTRLDQIFFYYKDIRVIEVPKKDDPVPGGYVRVTFKADKGGSFGKDVDGNDITELYYDVIKGLKSDLLPVPENPTEENNKKKDKYYITPETGKKFTGWDKKPLLNKNTIVDNDTKDFYVFTAFFDWSGLTAKRLVRTEAYKDPDGKWTNDFAPKIKELKKQLVWKVKDDGKPLPDGTEISFTDESGNPLTKDEDVYKLVNEKGEADSVELVRIVNIKAKVKFKDGKEEQILNIPVKVYKNVYEALTSTKKPKFLLDAEKSTAENGGLKDVTGDYVKVIVNPTGKPGEKDSKIYYVNRNAWVEIPEIKLTEKEKKDLGFTNWTADKKEQNEENGVYDFSKRHKFTEDTEIKPGFAKDVVEQTDPNKKPDVPSTYVKVIVKTTDKATEPFEKTFWVNPNKEVTIGVTNPTGKTVAADPAKVGTVGYKYDFSKWETEDKSKTWTDKILGQFEKDTTIVAKYTIDFEKIRDIDPKTDKVHTPQGKTPSVEEIKEKLTPPEGKTIKEVKIVENPNVKEPGDSKVKVIVEYTDGSSVGTKEKPIEIPVKVHEPIVKANPDGSKPETAMKNYVKVIFKAGTGGTVSGDLVYYVSPEVEVNMTSQAEAVTKTPSVGYTANGGTWSPEIKAEKITAEKTYKFNFVKSKDIVEKTDENTKKPDGYVTVIFKTDGNGTVGGVAEKIYFVNPSAGIKLGDKATDDNKTLVVPTPTPNKNFAFKYWQENIDKVKSITNDRTHVAIFKSDQVTLTYDKGGEDVTGDLPAAVTVNYGTTVGLPRKGTLARPNATFEGWEIGETIYQPGDQVTLKENTTATAKWKTSSHTVTFDTKGGSKVDSQQVEHGKTATEPNIKPKLDKKVFMGWKEKGKENEDSYFDFNTPIETDKTLVAQWQDAVKVIGENDTVEEQFIKVTFKEGDHGKLKLSDQEQTSPVTYKVAKDYTFDQAVKAGLKVPEIAPAKYYKAKEENSGWDTKLELNGQNIEFTAQYEPKADVIPVDPEVTDEDQIKKEKPDGMVIVEFVVPADKAYMDAASKFYVVKNKVVSLTPPTVYNSDVNYSFTEWQDYSLQNGLVVSSFNEEYTQIQANGVEIPDIDPILPRSGDNIVTIKTITSGAIGYIKMNVNGEDKIIKSQSKTQTRRVGRRRVTTTVYYFELPRPVETGEEISYWAIKAGIKSKTKYYIVE